MSKKYELLYYTKTSTSRPLDSIEEVKRLISQETGVYGVDLKITSESTFTTEDGQLIQVNAFSI